jgi:hypothetical protein
MRIRFFITLPKNVTKVNYKTELERKAFTASYVEKYASAEQWCHKKNPILVVYDANNQKELIYGYKEGYIGDQLLLV